MFPLASTFDPSKTAFSIEPLSNFNASIANIFDIGLLFLFDDAYPSIACTIASIPVAAVVLAGSPRVKSGSRTAKSGNIKDEETPFFSSSPTVIIDTGVTSEPVPAVVGINTNGKRGPFAFDTPQASSKFSLEPIIKAANFATSIDDPPPKPTIPVALIFFPISIAFKRVF